MNLRLENNIYAFVFSKNKRGNVRSKKNLIQQIFLLNRHMLSVDINIQQQEDGLIFEIQKKYYLSACIKHYQIEKEWKLSQQIKNNHLLKIDLKSRPTQEHNWNNNAS